MRHEPVELVPALVPLDAVEVVAVEVVAADQVGAVPGLDVPRDTEVDLGQTLQLYNISSSSSLCTDFSGS